MFSKPSTSRSGSDLVLEICPPCGQFIPESRECRFVKLGDAWFIRIFDGMRCRPREFLEKFLTRRLMRRYGSASAARYDAEEITSTVVMDLVQRPPDRFFRSYDLIGQRQFLASRAVQKEVDFRRAVEGRMRCGNCAHHLVEGRVRRCHLDLAGHFWSGKTVKASEDPRRFKPPCDKYRSHRLEEVYDSPEREDPGLLASTARLPETEVSLQERNEVLLDCLAAVQKASPNAHRALVLAFFEHKTNDEIAGVMACSDKSVKRYRAQGLELLKREMSARGVRDLDAVELESSG